MAQHITIGPRQRSFHRQLLASKAFEQLPAEDQATLAALPAPTRTALYDIWEPDGADADAAFGTNTHLEPLANNPVFWLERTLHGWTDSDGEHPGLRPDCPIRNNPGATSTFVEVFASIDQWVKVEGFDRHGDLAGDVKVTTRAGHDYSERTIAQADFDARALAAEIASALPTREVQS